MPIKATAGSKFRIGTTVAAATLTEYTADTYTTIANIEDMGKVGSQAEILEGKYVDAAYVRKFKGARDNGTLSLVVSRDSADAGYIALIAAEKTDNEYNFQIELTDKPAAGASPKNSRFFFRAIVASAVTSLDGADNITKTTFELAVSGAVLEVAASAT